MRAGFPAAWLAECARVVAAERERLTALDAAIGDADHGANLDRGFAEVRRALAAAPEADALVTAGTTLIRKVGGASGPLYGSLLRAMGAALGAQASPAEFAAAFTTGVEAVARLGRSAEGDKTMLDALWPAARALTDATGPQAPSGLPAPPGLSGSLEFPEISRLSAAEVFGRAATAARAGAAATVPMLARKGRASYLGERSVGHEDPGAASSALLVGALETVADEWGGG
ncbi:dihydroxyacetone kinase subunit DhaL [Nonomuraea longicatena]|uniref:Dihydroxyacetone kinase subunit DhaL n=2 Tax=Nonomuraea longicatena TaxID=83682 RepID=A0ABN1P825_9ACTN